MKGAHLSYSERVRNILKYLQRATFSQITEKQLTYVHTKDAAESSRVVQNFGSKISEPPFLRSKVNLQPLQENGVVAYSLWPRSLRQRMEGGFVT